jgi:hypothetical protein
MGLNRVYKYTHFARVIMSYGGVEADLLILFSGCTI